MGDEVKTGGSFYVMDGDEWRHVGTLAEPPEITLSGETEFVVPREMFDSFESTITFEARLSRKMYLTWKALFASPNERRNYEKSQRRSRRNSRRKK